MDILNRINELKNQKGWTIYKLSEESGITQSTLSNMFTRKTMPSISTLIQLCDAFNISLAEFFSDSKNQNNEELSLISNYRRLSTHDKRTINELINILSKNTK